MAYRDRLCVLLGVAGFALAVIIRDSDLAIVLFPAVAAGMIVNGFISFVRFSEIRRRPAAFTVAGGKFIARLAFSQGMLVALLFTMLGTRVGDMLRDFDDPDRDSIIIWINLNLATLFGLVVIVLAVMTWWLAPARVELTPEGVVTRTLWDWRHIPWEALAPGGPSRPRSHESGIRLVFARPELVRRSRFRLLGPRDMITTQLDVHTSLVADAIRWYAENPGDRAAIGSQAEHDRLLGAVGAAAYQEAPATEQPPNVRTAIRLGYAGVAFGLLTALLDVALAFGFEDLLRAHAVAVGEQEMRDFGGEPADWESGVFLQQEWLIGVLAFTMLAALVALMSIRALKRGNQAGRLGLIWVSTVAALWALMPCFDTAFDAPPGLGTLLLTVSAVKRLGYLGLGVATLLLLVTPSAQAFTEPRQA